MRTILCACFAIPLLACGNTADSTSDDATAATDATSTADVGLHDAAVPQPDGLTSAPADAAVVTPDAAVVTPDAAVVSPDAAVVPLDAAVVTPDAAVVTPDAAIVPPDAALPVSTATGQPCAVAADCGDGFDCNTEVRGGYCMPGSPGGPTACRPPDVTCPDQTHCSPLPWHQISGVCLLACDSPSDCREGYDCQVVSLFPGDPSSPTSDGTVCWVRQVCQPGMDQTCNDNPALNSIHGVCRFDGTCECNAGFALNPDTGRCL